MEVPAGPLTARFCALRVRPTKGRGDRWLQCERSVTDERKYYLLHLPETAALVRKLMAERGLPVPPSNRVVESICIVEICKERTWK